MRLKLDENIDVAAAERLRTLGFDVHTVLDEALGGCSDKTVWSVVQSEERFFVTQDLDFSDRRRFVPGTHHGVLLVRLADEEQGRIVDFLERWLTLPDAVSWTGCCVVATSRKVRVARPSDAT